MDDSSSRKDNKPVIKPSAIPRLTPSSSSSDLKQKIAPRRESNENEEDLISNHTNCYSSSSKLQNPKKPSTPKHFMSPTISAASKVSTPRKKILMERNDSFTETTSTHVSKTLIFDSKSPNSLSQIPTKISDFTENPGLKSSQITQISSLKMVDSISKDPPYDPKTNFLSPRPKFLRYNPNRRIEILKRREIELKQQEEQSGSDDQESDEVSSSSPSQGEDESSGLSVSTNEDESKEEIKGLPELEEDEEEDEEEEVLENGKGWSFFQVLKFLILLGFVGCSTFYISSMNVAAPNPVCDVSEGFKMFQNGLYQSGLEKSILWNVSSNPEMLVNKASNIQEVELGKAVEIPVQFEDEIFDDSEMNDVLENLFEINDGDEDVVENQVEISEGNEEIAQESDGVFAEESEVVEPVASEEVVEEFVAPEPVSNEVVAEESEAVEPVANEEFVASEPVKEFESQEPICSSGEVAEEFVALETVTDEVVAEESEPSELVSNEEDVPEESEVSQSVPNDVVAEEAEASKPVPNDVVAEEAEASKPVPNDVVAEEGEASKPVPKVELGILIVGLASLIFVFRCLKRRPQPVNESAPPSEATLTEVQETVIAETLEKAKRIYLPKKDEVVEGRVEKATESSFYSGGRVSEDLYRSNAAPAVQLLGEFIVEESGSSLRSCSVLKSKEADSEEDRFSVSMSEMRSRGRRGGTSSILQEDQTSISEFSNADSMSYGSFTTQEKITKRGGEDITTPVRRSSRIRTKSVTSP